MIILGVKKIDFYVFYGAEMEHIIFPNSVTEIGEKYSPYMPKLKSVTIPYGVNYIYIS